MSKIRISGAIVPSEYDIDWLAEYIEKGVITPESRFRADLDKAATDEPLEIMVNSQGGSVFAGAQMANEVKAWQVETGQPVAVTVGALAASAASTFVLEVGAPAQVHQNTRFMFHGASTEAWGGADHMHDTGDLLAKINQSITQTLTTRYKVDPDKVREWFEEGRMGWMNADELVASGIATGIIGENAARPAQLGDADALMQIAAVLKQADEDTTEEPETEKVEEAEGGESKAEPEASATDEGEEGETGGAPDEEDEEEEEQEGKDEAGEIGESEASQSAARMIFRAETAEGEARAAKAEVVRLKEEAQNYAKTIQKHEATIDRLNAALDAKQSKLDKLTDVLRDAEQRLARVAPGRSFQGEDTSGVIAWSKAMELAGSYEEARKKYPQSYQNYMKNEKDKK